MDSSRSPTPHELARSKIAEEHYARVERICRGIASVESLYYEDLLGPAAEGLMSAAEEIVTRGIEIRYQKGYIDAAVRNAVQAYIKKEKKQGFTHLSGMPLVIGLQEPMGDDGNRTVENTVVSNDNFEQEILVQNAISSVPAGYHEVLQLKAKNPFASNAEIAGMVGRDVEAVKSIIRYSRKYFNPKT